EALTSPLLDDIELTNAQGILVNVACDHSLKMGEINRIMGRVLEIASDDVDLKFGTSLDESLDGELRVTVVATGLGGSHQQAEHSANVTPINRQHSPQQPAADVNGHPRHSSVEVPAVMRESGSRVAVGQDFHSSSIPDEEVLNIPAFLRNQAD
ncbi:MAG: cell division protein FtsZ, partial [Algiphilus sp.]|nr:cell division protein FtsZ [Algiphilus sp.]